MGAGSSSGVGDAAGIAAADGAGGSVGAAAAEPTIVLRIVADGDGEKRLRLGH